MENIGKNHYEWSFTAGKIIELSGRCSILTRELPLPSQDGFVQNRAWKVIIRYQLRG